MPVGAGQGRWVSRLRSMRTGEVGPLMVATDRSQPPPSSRVVKDDPQRVPPPGPDGADPVAHRHPIIAARSAYRPRVHREDHRVALRQRSEEHTSELQSLMRTPSAVHRLKKKKINRV